MDPLIFLTSLTLILLAGLVSVSLSKKFKLPLSLILLISGIILGNITVYRRPVVDLGGDFLSAFSIIALVLVLFDCTSKIRFYEFDKAKKEALIFFAVALVLNAVILTYFARPTFQIPLFSALILSFLLSCVEYYAIFPRHHIPNTKLQHLLINESGYATAFILLIPLLIISFLLNVAIPVKGNFVAEVMPFVVNVFAGIGAGIIVALILFNLMTKHYLEKASSLIVAISLLIGYLVAQKIGGNGFVAVATIGFIFGNIFVKQKQAIRKHENVINSILEIFMFVIAGAIVGIPLNMNFLELSFAFFLIYILIRGIATAIALWKYDFHEKMEIALFVPKGLATITVAFALLNYTFSGVVLIVQMLIMFYIYSMITDTVLDKAGFYKHR